MVIHLQSVMGFPKLEDRLFIVGVFYKQNYATAVVAAENSDDAIQKVEKRCRALKLPEHFMVYPGVKPFTPKFDCGERIGKLFDEKGEIHEYVPCCPGGGINLNLHEMGFYKSGYSCGNDAEIAEQTGVKFLQWQYCAMAADDSADSHMPTKVIVSSD